MRKWLFFSSFMKPGKEWGWNETNFCGCSFPKKCLLVVGGASVGGWRSFCWWLVELLLEKKQSLRLGGFEGLVCSEKTVIFAERFVERFFLSVNSCMIGSYLRFEKK